MVNFKSLICVIGLMMSSMLYAVTMYYPGDTDGTTATDQATKPPQYYPAQKPNPINPNPNLPNQYQQNTNVQGRTAAPPPAPTSH